MRFIFGFGSLVNDATHRYEIIAKARVTGFERQWVAARHGSHSFLSVTAQKNSEIEGLVLGVAEEDLAQLDIREKNYHSLEISPAAIRSSTPIDAPVFLYQASPDAVEITDEKPILQTYLDCVFQGYEAHFGAASIEAFIKTTNGWERGIHNDRADPIYPRAVPVDALDCVRFDQILSAGG